MDVTFIIGNGFDQGAGLNTRYRDFYDYLLDPSHPKPTKPYVQTIVDSISKDRNRNYSDWKDFEEGLGHFTKNFQGLLYAGLKLKYPALRDSSKAFSDCFAYVRQEICLFLQKELSKFDPHSLPSATIDKLHRIIGEFASQTSGHRVALERVLNSKLNEDWHIQAISLNYSTVFDVFLEKYAKIPRPHPMGNSRKLTINPQVLHLHGKFPEAIFGVGNDNQIANRDFRNNASIRSLLIKPEVVEAGGRDWYTDALGRIDRSTFVCVYGLSLGKTDTPLWHHIANWLFSDENHQLVIFWYDKELALQGMAFQNAKAAEVEEIFMGYVYDWVRELSLCNHQAMRIEAIRDQIHVKVHDYTF